MPKQSPVWFWGTCLLMTLACSEKSSTDGASGNGGDSAVSGGGSGSGTAAGSNAGGGSVNSAGSSGASASGGTATSSGGAGGSPAAVGGTASGGTPACAATEGLKVTRLDTIAISMMGKPYDSDSDKTSPWGWDTNYGKPPEIVALPDGENLDILWQDHSADVSGNQMDPNKNAKKAFVVRVEKSATGYAVTRAYQIDQLAHIMGLAKDESGNYYVATGVDEDADLTPEDPGPGEHRPGIVKLVKFDVNGCKLLEIDADNERQKADPKSEPIINPMVAATSRLAYHAGRLALVHGINVDYDEKVMARHQKAMTTHFDSMTGAATLTSSMWVSHSFDQRLFYDGTGFLEVHLGDAYPRSIVLGRFNDQKSGTKSFELFKPKGDEGDNNTFTRLGGIAPIASGDWGYLVVFTTERGTDDTSEILNGTRDLAFLRVSRGFASMDEKGSAFVDGASTQAVMSSAEAVTNKLSWLTDYTADSAQADRPRLAAIGGDQFVVLWERWTGSTDRQNTFVGTQALLLAADGTVKVMPKQLGTRHLSRS
ncbi:MAG TPA: hypothetical protein VEQ58_08600, partial [Polyangiaceae bacterium]|nr:hypothetical protein [Polyangiaceae bacterium]